MPQPIVYDDAAIAAKFRPFALKMEALGMPPIVVNVFKSYYSRLLLGAQGKLAEAEIAPLAPADVRDYDDLDRYTRAGHDAMSQAVFIKLNGGLGTGMGLEKAKSFITVKDGLSFLDIILSQTRRLREKFKVELPLLLMNSFKTHQETMLRLGDFDNGETELPLAFLQHRYPKVLVKDFSPAEWPANPELEWNPPGHGDIYTALVTSKILKRLLANGYHYAFISNSDNLGAVMDERILGLMALEELPFIMEVADRTPLDSKGGHLARRLSDNRLVLREVAQCPEADRAAFADTTRHRYFNTNSIWLDLRVFERVFVEHHMMPLDIIINPKNLDPRDSDSPNVFQIETAMGSAVSNFENAAAVRVPRSRFAPVKTTNDLLTVMSDCYVRTEEETIVPVTERAGNLPSVKLDPKYYKKIDDFGDRFPEGAPSLIGCTSLTVEGDVRFEAGVKLSGEVKLVNAPGRQVVIPAGTELSGERNF